MGTADDARRVAQRMGDVLRHRGPDSGGVWCDPSAGVALAHRRLSVIDLSSGAAQPMHSPCGRYVLSFNGEVYNYLTLRADLEERGEQFLTTSDTEVLLRALAVYGVERAVGQVNGMFAFALWDRDLRALTLARDKLGEKPLYHAAIGEHFFFGSELKALLEHPQCPREVDRDALVEYFRFQCFPAPSTILRGVRKLEPGSLLKVVRRGGRIAAEGSRYWSAASIARSSRAKPMSDPLEAVDRLDSLVRNAVGMRMVADVPLGAFLSGGIDSSLVVAAMQAQSKRPVKTFTIGFDDARFDESHFARAVARHLGTDHTELILRAEDIQQVIPDLPTIYDEPFADSSQLPTFLVAQLARREVTVALSGDGGDELFAGYGHYRRFARLAPPALALPSFVRTAARWGARRIPARTSQRLRPGAEAAISLASARDRGDFYERMLSAWRRPEALVVGAPRSSSAPATPDWLEASEVEFAMLHDTCHYLPDDILVKVDRATMAVALEARVPFLDPRIFELAWSMPLEWKRTGTQGKKVLASVLARYVPPALFERPKSGFGVPIGDWLRGPMREWAADLLSTPRLAAQGILDPTLVENAWREHLARTRDRTNRLWSILMFQAWFDVILKPPAARLTL